MDDDPASTPVRLALLEKGQADTERRHTETKMSLASVHRRVTEATDSNREALETVKTEIIRAVQLKNKDCETHRAATKDCQNDIKWIQRWVTGAWAAIAAGIGLIIHGGGKHQ